MWGSISGEFLVLDSGLGYNAVDHRPKHESEGPQGAGRYRFINSERTRSRCGDACASRDQKTSKEISKKETHLRSKVQTCFRNRVWPNRNRVRHMILVSRISRVRREQAITQIDLVSSPRSPGSSPCRYRALCLTLKCLESRAPQRQPQ